MADVPAIEARLAAEADAVAFARMVPPGTSSRYEDLRRDAIDAIGRARAEIAAHAPDDLRALLADLRVLQELHDAAVEGYQEVSQERDAARAALRETIKFLHGWSSSTHTGARYEECDHILCVNARAALGDAP